MFQVIMSSKESTPGDFYICLSQRMMVSIITVGQFRRGTLWEKPERKTARFEFGHIYRVQDIGSATFTGLGNYGID